MHSSQRSSVRGVLGPCCGQYHAASGCTYHDHGGREHRSGDDHRHRRKTGLRVIGSSGATAVASTA